MFLRNIEYFLMTLFSIITIASFIGVYKKSVVDINYFNVTIMVIFATTIFALIYVRINELKRDSTESSALFPLVFWLSSTSMLGYYLTF